MSEGEAILIVDSNEPFAAVLKDGLEQSGEYIATVVTSGDEALEALAAQHFAMAIVDMGLENPDSLTLAHQMRHRQQDLRLMLIPLLGEDLPPEAADLDYQGVLPKPFFFPELPERIAEALARPLGREQDTPAQPTRPPEAPPQAEAAPPTLPTDEKPVDTARLQTIRQRISDGDLRHIVRSMTALAQEVNAEAVILTYGGGLLAHAGRLSLDDMESLARVIGENRLLSARVAQILGQEQQRFEQSVEGGEHLLYSRAIADDIILSAALRGGVPLGMLRHRAKATAEAIHDILAGII